MFPYVTLWYENDKWTSFINFATVIKYIVLITLLEFTG